MQARTRQLIDSAEPAALVTTAVLVAAAITLMAGAAIVVLVGAVMDPDQASTADERIVAWIDDHRSPERTTVLRATTHLADYWFAVFVVSVTATVLLIRRHRAAAVAVIASSTGAMLVTEVLKVLIGRERPPFDSHLVHATGLAFPSGHSSQSVACYGGLALVAVLTTRRTGPRVAAVVAATVIALAVGTSRVYLGVHWPSDVLSGWIVGLTWLALVATAAWLLRRLDRPHGWWPSRTARPRTATADAGTDRSARVG